MLLHIFTSLLPQDCVIRRTSPGDTVSAAAVNLLKTNRRLYHLGKAALQSKYKSTPLILIFTIPPPMPEALRYEKTAESVVHERHDKFSNFLRLYGECFDEVHIRGVFASLDIRSFDWFPNLKYLEVSHSHWYYRTHPSVAYDDNNDLTFDWVLDTYWTNEKKYMIDPFETIECILQGWRDRGSEYGRFNVGVRFKVEVQGRKMRGEPEMEDHWEAVVVGGESVGEDVRVELVKRERVYHSRKRTLDQR
jgi:hypothetical protein